jgi:O-antigen/teichoic acid export membrane protein
MLGGVLLPYLSADWERGNGQRIANRIRQLAHAVCLGSMAIAAASMLAAPYLFHFAFGARYELALQVLPIALLQVTWMGMFLVAEPYLLCAERGKELVWLLLTAFIANLLLNVFLIPIFGLHGGMLATAAASLLAVGLLYWRLSCNGCWLGRASWLLLLAPTTIVFGPQWTVAGLLMLVVIAGRTEWLLAKADREHLDSMLLPKLSRYGIRLNSLWP